ncbi:DEAD/DEAH box helicase [Azoarcus sp. KH32C]|uniref:DEAD/DEAH box helicase n=1 Tax=Azoarcus sp. KH32C TaxID=748247 RepID=UPI0002385FCC|nr:DEAD/DEAH box helicase [Azoarcus sp. KH32C]BAL23495.1 Lhr-like helicase [Azoarcus sp. KH32C]
MSRASEPVGDPFDTLHPALQYHVVNSLGWSSLRPTQRDAILPIRDGRHCLLLAPTAGGKTEAAIIPVLSRMLTENWIGVSVLYVCPIKALLNNLAQRLEHYAGLVGRRVELWHGDVSQSRKQRALKDPPDIILTTPESVEGMLISTRVERQAWFGSVRAVVVDELHAFAGDDRGWHLRSILARLEGYVCEPPQRIGLSATVRNPEQLLAWFAPFGEREVVGSASVSTDADVTVDFVGSIENAATVISRLHRGKKRLVFCDSRSQTEQIGNLLRQHGLRTFVSHASLSASERKQAESAFAEEKDCVIVATSTLELGIDVGDLDYVIQIDAPSTVSSFLQRMGRTGRRQGARRNCLFLATTDQAFLLTLGLAEQWTQGWVEAAIAPPESWGVVAQQTLTVVLEHGALARTELLSKIATCFPECGAADLEVLVDGLVELGYLHEAGENVLQVGPETEREYGRAHYRGLLATFEGSSLLTARHAGSDIGFVDPSALSGHEERRNILLAGRTWRIVDVDWGRRIVTLEPASGGGTARWTGVGRVLGAEVCGAIRTALSKETLGGVTLSKRAALRLEELQGAMPTGDGQVITRDERGRYRVWTYAGTISNRLLYHRIREQAGGSGYDELGVDTRRDPTDALRAAPELPLQLRESEIQDAKRSMKFAQCVPERLFARTLEARLFGWGGALGSQ